MQRLSLIHLPPVPALVRNKKKLKSFQSKKKMEVKADSDKISCLPDELLHEILSSVDMREMVQLSVLSRRWRYVWRSVEIINISYQQQDDLPTIMDNLLNNCFTIKSFRLNSHEGMYFNHYPKFDIWMDTLVTRNLQEIHIRGVLFASSSAVICLASQVKTMELVALSIGEFWKMKLNLKCPAMESLTLDVHYFMSHCITIDAPRLKFLSIHNPSYHAHKTSCEIVAPSLSILHFKGQMFRDLSLKDPSSILTAHTDIKHYMEEDGINHKELARSLNNLLRVVANVESLALSARPFQVREEFLDMFKAVNISFPNIKNLTVTNWDSNYYMPALAKLFEGFSGIETLLLSTQESCSEKEWSKQLVLECNFPELKSVEIQGLQGTDNELKFLEILLKGTPALEKITITTTKASSVDKVKMLTEFSKNLQSLPRASSRVTMSFLLNYGTSSS